MDSVAAEAALRQHLGGCFRLPDLGPNYGVTWAHFEVVQDADREFSAVALGFVPPKSYHRTEWQFGWEPQSAAVHRRLRFWRGTRLRARRAGVGTRREGGSNRISCWHRGWLAGRDMGEPSAWVASSHRQGPLSQPTDSNGGIRCPQAGVERPLAGVRSNRSHVASTEQPQRRDATRASTATARLPRAPFAGAV